jgi:ubiquinone/menaquinone biosynthesis C-methylase UbiE
MPGMINWNDLRKFVYLSTTGVEPSSGSFWDKRADAFNEHMAQMQAVTDLQLSGIRLQPDYTVLDIGAGTGRVAIPVAKRVKQVTAIDFSRKMLDILKSNAERAGANNISCINERWEALEVGRNISPHDVVIASLSFNMIDLEKELKKMDAVARKRVYLFMSASKWMDTELQKTLYGSVIHTGADHIYIFNILYDLGILANVEVWSYDSVMHYASLDDAVSKFMELYRLSPKDESALRGYLRGILMEDAHELCFTRKRKLAMIWWKKTE